jgi:hypothetical protein
MVAFDHCGISYTTLHHIGIDGTLYQVVYLADLPGFFFKYPDKFFPDNLPLCFRVGYTLQAIQESLLCIDPDQVQMKPIFEYPFHLIPLVLPKQTMIYKNADKIAAYGLMQ